MSVTHQSLINNSSVSTDEKDHQRMIYRMKRMGLVGGNLAFFWLIALTCLSLILLYRLLINNPSVSSVDHPLMITPVSRLTRKLPVN